MAQAAFSGLLRRGRFVLCGAERDNAGRGCGTWLVVGCHFLNKGIIFIFLKSPEPVMEMGILLCHTNVMFMNWGVILSVRCSTLSVFVFCASLHHVKHFNLASGSEEANQEANHTKFI